MDVVLSMSALIHPSPVTIHERASCYIIARAHLLNRSRARAPVDRGFSRNAAPAVRENLWLRCSNKMPVGPKDLNIRHSPLRKHTTQSNDQHLLKRQDVNPHQHVELHIQRSHHGELLHGLEFRSGVGLPCSGERRRQQCIFLGHFLESKRGLLR